MTNGKRNQNYTFQKLEMWKTRVKLTKRSKTGIKEESSDMVGERPKTLLVEVVLLAQAEMLGNEEEAVLAI